MLKKLLLAAAALYGVWAVSVHMNDKLMRGYFMAPLKFKDLVAEDNMSEREGRSALSRKSGSMASTVRKSSPKTSTNMTDLKLMSFITKKSVLFLSAAAAGR